MKYDLVVVGAGIAGLCAALAARECGVSVLILERSTEQERGGNTRFSGGAMRFAYAGLDDLRSIMPDLTEAEIARTDFGSYPSELFYDDMFRLTRYRTDPDLCEQLVTKSLPMMQWLASKSIPFIPMYGRQAFEVDGRFQFWGGLTVEVNGGGFGLVDRLCAAIQRAGAVIRYGTHALELLRQGDQVRGVRLMEDGVLHDVSASAVILAAGGFEANPEWRARYLGAGWDLAKVRGSRFDVGTGLQMALDVGAAAAGHWSGCHAVCWDYHAPEFVEVGDTFQRHSFPWSIMINSRGRRFVDEGADFRNFTYATMGGKIMQQPEQFAWQLFDGKVVPFLREEYRSKGVTKVTSDTLPGLARQLAGVDAEAVLEEIRRYNVAVKTDVPFNPNVKDGRGTVGLEVPKSNWANTIDEPPFEAYQVGCAITYTYGGLRVDPKTAQVMNTALAPIPGLYAAGELVGGLFYFNYPGGSSLTAGAVFGRIAGTAAASACAHFQTTPRACVGQDAD